MGIVKVNFSRLNEAIRNAGNVATKLETYGEDVYNHNYSKLTGISGGGSSNTSDAASQISGKKNDVTQNIATKFSTFETTLTDFRDKVEEADTTVKNYISAEAKGFAEEHGISCGPIETAWRWLCNGASSILNNFTLGQWINNSLRKVGDWFSNTWDDLRQWYAFDGGEFVVNIVLGVAAIAAAIFTIATAGVGIVAFCAIVGAAIGIANAVVKIGTSIAALVNHDKDPAWARRCAADQKLSAMLDTNFPDNKILHAAGKIVDTVEGICLVVSATDGLTKTYTKITGKETMFQKYLGAGGVLDSAFVKYTGNATNQACQYNALAGRWEKLDANGNVMLDISGNPVTVDFSTRNSIKENNLKWDLKTGVNNLKSEIYGETMLKYYGNMAKDDFVGKVTVASSGVKNVLNYAKSYQGLDMKGGIKKAATDTVNTVTEALKNRYGNIKSDSWLNTIKNSASVVGSKTWKVTSEYTKDLIGSQKINDIFKNQEKISKLKIPNLLKGYLHTGVFVNNIKTVYDHYTGLDDKTGKNIVEDITKVATKNRIPIAELKKYIDNNEKLWKTVFDN